MIPALVLFVIGLFLGNRFKVMVLIVTVPVALGFTFITTYVLRHAFLSALFLAYAGAASLQVGYIFGMLTRWMISDFRGRSRVAQTRIVNRPREYKSH
jgi:hypothetical protein